MDKEYIVTLHRKEDLEQFYNEMRLSNFPLVMKRPLSRNTHYMMTDEQAERLRQDPRVWGVERKDLFVVKPHSINNEPYSVTGNFWKDDTIEPITVGVNDFQWGHLHCAGNQAQRGKGQFGSGGSYEQITDAVEVFNDGRHVDVVIVDDPVSSDCEEWYSPTTNETRFVEYQWFNELNSIVSSIDDDGIPLPTGTITYYDNDTNPTFHGVHVTGTVAGQHYGWAREANIYNLVITSPWSSGQQPNIMVIFDYLRAFHLNKDINPETGFRNPTITNHSYGGYIDLVPIMSDITSINYRGTTYNSSNPGPSGWSSQGIEKDFGLRFTDNNLLAWSAAIAADVQDAIDDGVVIIGAAGNSNYFIASENDDDWDNSVTISGYGTPFYYHRGSWPNTPDSGSIIVGALSNRADFRRSSYTNYGSGIDVFAPGDDILSAFTNPTTNNYAGLTDSKYTLGSGNWFYPINGTSMASPQICGTSAILASGKRRFTNSDVRKYLNDKCIDGDMTFDLNVSSFNIFGVLDLYVVTKDNSNFKIYGRDDRTGTVYNGDNNPSLTIMEGDLFYLRRQGGGYPTTPFTFGSVFSDTDPTHGYENLIVFQDSTSYAINGSHRENPIGSIESNPDLTIQVGDRIAFMILAPAAGSPMYIKTALSNGTTNQVSGAVGQGATNENDVLYWVPTSAGTYYYQSSTNYDANGTITVVANGTYTGPHPLWIKTALGSGSTNALPSDSTGDTDYIIANNGRSYGEPVIWPAYPGSNDPESFTTEGMAGTYYYQCGNHPGMYGTLTIVPRPTTAGDFTDMTARKGSPNRYLHVENPRPSVGYIREQKGKRITGQTFPRTAIYNTVAPAPTSQTLTFTVTASSSTNYTFAGDATGNDPTINCNVGDTLEFNLSTGVTSHPFWIKTSATTGTSNGVTTGTLSANGQTTGTMTWDTTGVTPGTYYYICQFHSGMVGQIIIS